MKRLINIIRRNVLRNGKVPNVLEERFYVFDEMYIP